MEKDFSIMHNILSAITSTSEWNNAQLNNAQITEASETFYKLLARASSYLPEDIISDFDSAYGYAIAVHHEAAILYGIRVSEVIRSVIADPMKFSQYELDRFGGMQAALQ